MAKKVKTQTVRGYVKCAAFDISVDVVIANKRDLSKEEMSSIQRKLKQKLSEAIASLPFSEIYPYEARMR